MRAVFALVALAVAAGAVWFFFLYTRDLPAEALAAQQAACAADTQADVASPENGLSDARLARNGAWDAMTAEERVGVAQNWVAAIECYRDLPEG